MSLASFAPADDRYRMPKGSSHVRTREFDLAQTALASAVEMYELAGVFGDPGTGKTHALTYFLEHNPIEHAYLTASARPQAKEIFEEILLRLVGSFDDAPARVLRRRCIEVLGDLHPLLVVDESQHLSYTWHQELRSMHDAARFTLVVAGADGAVRTLKRDAALWNRFCEKVFFRPLQGQELLNALAAFHPLLAKTEPQLLLDIDSEDCRGVFRNWAHVVKLAQPLAAKSSTPDRLSEKVVRAMRAMRQSESRR